MVERLVESQLKIIDFIKQNAHVSKKELSDRIGISTTAVDKNIAERRMDAGHIGVVDVPLLISTSF